MDYEKTARQIAKTALEIKAIKLNPENPTQWASGYRMPIYNDNRMFLFFPEYRELITAGFVEYVNIIMRAEGIKKFSKDYFDLVIAGTSTAGISPGTSLANYLRTPFIYVRDKPKDHGLRNQIEGISSESDLSGRKVILIEDLISTGGSSAKAVQAIRDAKGTCNHCLSIFNYNFDSGAQEFEKLNPSCNVNSLLEYNQLLEVAKKTGYINSEQIKILEEWRADPFNWGRKTWLSKGCKIIM